MCLTLSAVNPADDELLPAVLATIAEPRVSIKAELDRTYTVSADRQSHLESICRRLPGACLCAVNLSPVKAVLLETIRGKAEAEGKYIRQTGGSGNYGHCKLGIEPNECGEGYEFVNDIRAGAVPPKYISSIDRGVQSALELGILGGFPIVDVKVTLYDGSYHEVDSNEMAFEFAGTIAFKEAARKANPVLLEPVMAVEIDVPEELAAAMRRDVYAHRGRIKLQRSNQGWSEIEAIVPLTELLNSASTPLAQFPMEFAGYEARLDRGPSTDRGIGVTADKPNHPRPGSRSASAPLEHEDD
jgi:elongation factor G